MTTTQDVAAYIVGTGYGDFDAETVHRAKALFLSSLGMMVAGSKTPSGQVLAEYAKSAGSAGESGIAGMGFRTSAELAAFVNATAAHSTELEDDSWPEAMYTCHLIPAVFALGEELQSSGKDIIEAFIIGYEVQARPGMILTNGGATERGNLSAPHLGAIGVAAAASKLLGLDQHKTTMALSLAVSQASGSTRQMGTGAHLFEAGVAGRNGITAAKLAKLGLTGVTDILEGPKGYFDALAGMPEIDFHLGTGKDLRMMEVGFKKYTACYLMQRVIDGIMELASAHEFSADDVAEVIVEVNLTFPEIIKFPKPKDGDEARFSLHHSVAVALSGEDITMWSFSDEAVLDPALQKHWDKTTIRVNPDWPRAIYGEANPVTIRLKDGREVEKLCAIAHGDPEDSLSDTEVGHKYMSCCDDILTPENARNAEGLVWQLDKANDVRDLMHILTFDRPLTVGTQ